MTALMSVTTTVLISLAFGMIAIATLIHLASVANGIRRCRPRGFRPMPVSDAPPVTLVRPLCGLDADAEDTLRSSFELGYPRYELLFCVASPSDPVVPLARKLIAQYPGVDARLLIGDDRVSANPKLNNCVKGWRAARHGWVVLSDSNVILPHDYLERLMAAWDESTGLVCAPPIGSRPRSPAAELECAFLNEYQARWQYFADSLGAGFAQGKTMLWRRAFLDARGGLEVLGQETAEDAAATKIVREAGLNVRLVDGPFPQPLGARRFRDVWLRQVRWARLRRASFPLCFALEIVSGGWFPAILLALAAGPAGFSAWLAVPFVAVWYAAEAALAAAAGWPLSWKTLFFGAIRDLLIPALWVEGWRARGFEWRGNSMAAVPGGAG
jgi:ceramide glucosyltransferase